MPHLRVSHGQMGHLLATRKQARGNHVRKCVCSSLVCLVQNWFRAPGHRKTTTLHSRHVCEASSRGSTIAIQQRWLQTPKWVCSVLQCPAWQSATYSASSAPNIPPPLLLLHSVMLSILPFSVSFSLASQPSQSWCDSLLHTLTFLVYSCI